MAAEGLSVTSSTPAETDVSPTDNAEPIEADILEESSEEHATPLRSVPRSGRIWKHVKTARFSALIKDKGIRSSWTKKQTLRQELEQARSLEQRICDEKRKLVESRKAAREERERRRLENERKAEIVVPIKDTAKLKRLKRKQWRFVEKRDITQVNKK